MAFPAPNPPRPPSSDELVHTDGEPMESGRHWEQMVMLIQSLKFAWRERSDFYVGGNMFLYFSETQTRRNDFRGPDVFVVLDTTRRERKAWVVWEEDGKTPDVVIELLSESTEHVDRGEKMRIYAQQLRVAEYFLFDPWSGAFEGYELDAVRGRYLRKKPDARGMVRSDRLGVSLAKVRSNHDGVEADWLRWVDDAGKVLPLPAERANVEAERANVEAERANVEAERANVEAERANVEAERANAEAERANAEADRANAETERANRLAAELAALKAGKA